MHKFQHEMLDQSKLSNILQNIILYFTPPPQKKVNIFKDKAWEISLE